MSDLENIGYSNWFKSRADVEKVAVHSVARIVSVHKNSYTVTKGGEDIFAELSGNLLYYTDKASNLPTVGDWVYVDFYDEDTHTIIHDIFSRKSLLKIKKSTFNQMSYLGKRKKDKSFGKLVTSTMKHKKR